jgi:hypothetical protein
MKPLATPLGCSKTATKWLVIGYQPKNFWPGTRKTIAKYTRKGYAVVVRGLKPQQHTQAGYDEDADKMIDLNSDAIMENLMVGCLFYSSHEHPS